MKLTKNDMARVIVTALYNRPALVAANHPEVIKRARRGTVETLARQHRMAVAVLTDIEHPAAPAEGERP